MQHKIVQTLGLLILMTVAASCGSDPLPKPASYLLLQYPENSYKPFNNKCNYSFEISKHAIAKPLKNCWMKINYSGMKATLHITYRNVDNNLEEILKEVEKLTFKHTIKADAINATPYENPSKKVYGKIYNIAGATATNLLFSATDSARHVLAGALYFKVQPNYDSIMPALKYLEKDVKHLVETIEWKE